MRSLYFEDFMKNKAFKVINQKMNKVMQGYSLLYVSEKFDFLNNQEIYKNMKESELVIINQYEEINEEKNKYFIIGFKKTIIIVKQSSIILIYELLSYNPNLTIYFFDDTKYLFNHHITLQYKEKKFKLIDIFEDEIAKFKRNAFSTETLEISDKVLSCIAGYLINHGYMKTYEDRCKKTAKEPENQKEIQIYDENDFIFLRPIDSSNSAMCELYYHIDEEQLVVIKKNYNSDETIVNREINNLKNINHPFIPTFYGIIKSEEQISIIIEFINGHTLANNKNFNDEQKLTIIFDLCIIFLYLKGKNYIYRDLKPSNVMIDKNGQVVLIDFDRMVKNDIVNFTKDFNSHFVAPEITQKEGIITDKSDIYSIGKLINFIIDKKDDINYMMKILNDISSKCINIIPDERPSIHDLIDSFAFFFSFFDDCLTKEKVIENQNVYSEFYDILMKTQEDLDECEYIKRDVNKAIYYYSLAADQNDPEAQYYLGYIYDTNEYGKKDINKAIHYYSLAANQNYPEAQYNLGVIYTAGEDIARDINKAIHYYSLAAAQNDSEAQYSLGVIYTTGKYITRNINKAIHYLSLAAAQNHLEALYNLGVIYAKGEYVTRDIDKAIYYYSLAADQDHLDAQYNLGLIYAKGEYVTRDIDKAIHYYSLAADQNDPDAQYDLGVIYTTGEYIARDINKAIYYYSLAADQNHPNALYNLGVTYDRGEYVIKDINKAVYYYSLAADLNNIKSQYNLVLIYSKGEYIARDINKAIYYYSLAADQNYQDAQYNLALIYDKGEYVARDMSKAIYYYTLAANQNCIEAQHNLGFIYASGEYVTRNFYKTIHYFSLAANQNDPEAQLYLGFIYETDKYVPRNINKAIHYYSLAANQNILQAQNNLGYIYASGKYITRDINKAIHYLSLAADQNYAKAQFNLGVIYCRGEYIKRDINKAIHYYSLAANQNNSEAQQNLGLIYAKGEYVTRDINKAIYYFSLAADQNHSDALYNLGFIYGKGEYIKRDINKSFHYLSIAANKNHPSAQFDIGLFYFSNNRNKENIKKGVSYICQAALNGHIQASFAVGYLLHEGKYIQSNIIKALKFYKEASSFNNHYSKNNLGIIFKNGFRDVIPPNLELASEYFKEAIKQKNDKIAMYNLVHIYLYNDQLQKNFDSIELLIRSSNQGFNDSLSLLLILLYKTYGYNLDKIIQKLNEYKIKNISFIISNIIEDKSTYESLYQYYKNIDFLYNVFNEPVESRKIILEEIDQIYNKWKAKNISSLFYEGFGMNINNKQ